MKNTPQDMKNIPHGIKKYLFYTSRWTISVKNKEKEPIIIRGKRLKISKFDFKDLSNFSDQEILEIIKIDLWIDLIHFPKDGIEQINTLFFDANQVYLESILKKVFERKGAKSFPIDFKFTSVEEILSFIKEAGNIEGGWDAKLKCMMMKFSSSINDILTTYGLQNLDEKKKAIVDKLTPVLRLQEVWEDDIGTIGWHKFILYGRPKEIVSLEYKNLNDPDYSRAEDIKDPVWLTFELLWWWSIEYVQLFGIIQNLIIWLGWKIIDTKIKWLKLNKIDTNKLSSDLKLILLSAKQEKKSASHEKYIDLKFTCIIDGVNIEIKIVPHQNENQKWLQFQWVYAFLNKFIEWITMRHLQDGYIEWENIHMYCELFFENLQDMINKNPETVWMSKEDFLPDLWTDLQTKWYIRTWIKYINRSMNDNIKRYMINGLTEYYKSCLIASKLPNNKIVRRNERSKNLYEQKLMY